MFIGRLEVTIFLLTLKRGIKLVSNRRNNYSAHMIREKKYFTALDRKAYKDELAKKKTQAKLERIADREDASKDASAALNAIADQTKDNNKRDSF